MDPAGKVVLHTRFRYFDHTLVVTANRRRRYVTLARETTNRLGDPELADHREWHVLDMRMLREIK